MVFRKSILTGLIALALLASRADGAVIYYEGWDGGTTAGWVPSTVDAGIYYDILRGNPPGGLGIYSQGTGPEIGATTELAAASGDYAAKGVTQVSFDFYFERGPILNLRFRVRYLDATYNGWHYPIAGPYSDGTWTTYVIPIDPSWTDAQATAAGWVQEDPAIGFSQTMSAVYHPEVRCVAASFFVIDNFTLSGSDTTEVAVDIKPGSCPNPFLLKADGSAYSEFDPSRFEVHAAAMTPSDNSVLPVAILGSEDLDVADIDAETVTLNGVPVLRWSVEDVAGPVGEDAEECECTTAGPDGYLDLTLKFNRAALAATLGAVSDGDYVALSLAGLLLDGTAIAGSDCILIRLKGKGSLESVAPPVVESYPNPFNASATIRYRLNESGDVNLSVYNVLGQRVATLVDGHQAEGEHSISWSAAGVPSGVYFYRLQTAGAAVTRQMTLLK